MCNENRMIQFQIVRTQITKGLYFLARNVLLGAGACSAMASAAFAAAPRLGLVVVGALTFVRTAVSTADSSATGAMFSAFAARVLLARVAFAGSLAVTTALSPLVAFVDDRARDTLASGAGAACASGWSSCTTTGILLRPLRAAVFALIGAELTPVAVSLLRVLRRERCCVGCSHSRSGSAAGSGA